MIAALHNQTQTMYDYDGMSNTVIAERKSHYLQDVDRDAALWFNVTRRLALGTMVGSAARFRRLVRFVPAAK